jgi:uncharacterized SAM-binding protein YcdF (DUF218 family)
MRARKLRQERGGPATRGWRPLKHLASIAAALVVAYVLGFFWFATLLPTEVADSEQRTDAIVVLTGGSAEKAGKLFVSGVYHGVDVRQLLDLSQHSPEDLSCCIVLGYEADNTRGNAIETAVWMKQQGYRSLRLVTATYHMPRSLLELGRVMPEMEIVPHPVFTETFKREDWWLWPGSSTLLVTEYTKYLVALARGPLDPLLNRLAGRPAG